MKTRFSLGLALLLACVTALSAASRKAQWEKVEQARDQKLPQSAIAALEPIIAGAIADKKYAEALKAIGQKNSFERQIQGNKPEEQIAGLLAELTRTPPEMKPAVEALVARWYWIYFQRNRGRFLQRTQTAAPPGADFQTWDLARILTEIDRHYSAALADEKILKATPISAYDDLLERGNVPDAYRPTLFDFFAHEALEFYRTGEQGAIRAEDRFVIDADNPIFADTDAFIRWQPTTTDTESPALKSVRLYQKLLEFHRNDRDKSAFYDADFARLTFGRNLAVGSTKEERYQAALERFIQTTSKHEISARALNEFATRLNAAGDPTKGHELARRAIEAFPKSAGAIGCSNLIQQIEAKQAWLNTESVWSAPWPTLNVNYRNVTRVYFRAVPVSFADHLSRSHWGETPNFIQENLARTPALEWSAELPPTKDFRLRTESLPAPTTLKPGYYVIFASHDPSFGFEENQVSMARVWVSNLALVTLPDRDDGYLSGFVLKGESGEPVAGALVQAWERNREGWFKSAERILTNADGRFRFKAPRNNPRNLILVAEHEGHTLANSEPVSVSPEDTTPNRPEPETVFFTDRALYRPGQTIQFKGICIRSDPDKANYSALAGRSVTVALFDSNDKEVARSNHVANDYGSFSGSFTAPRDRVTGGMTLRVLEGPVGHSWFRVEEYKRPKFQVEIAAPTEAPKLGAPTRVTVKAAAYTGAALGGAKVKWNVMRTTQLPPWCWWWSGHSIQAIAHGTAVTEADGTFTVEFTAAPDRAVPEKNEPVFIFTIHASVTDSTGETRFANRNISVAYTALQATLLADEWQTPDKPVTFVIGTRSLDDVPQAAEGKITIHSLKQPAQVVRANPGMEGFSYHPNMVIIRPKPPGEPKVDPTKPESWETDRKVSELAFKTGSNGLTELKATLPAGIYRAELTTNDRFGKTVTARHILQVLDPAAPRYGVKIPNHLAAPKWRVEPGEEFTALWGTGYPTGRAFVELESAGKLLKSYWTDATRTQELITLPITEKLRGGLTLRVTYVRENRVYPNEQIVDVPWSNKELSLKWESFRSKLLPGQPETWTAVITGPEAERATAEMVASLYDASLDQFSSHGWRDGFGVFRREEAFGTAFLHNSLIGFNPVGGHWRLAMRPVEWRYRSFSDDLRGWNYYSDDDVIVLSPFAVSAEYDGVGYASASTLAGSRVRTELRDVGNAVTVVNSQFMMDVSANDIATPAEAPALAETADSALPPPDLSQVTARKNLNETAFFFPHLLTDENGVVKMQFTMPEALTEWKFLGFAHDSKMRSGFLTAKAVTAKDLMVEPNPPRFVREGDVIEFTVKVSNQSEKPQAGRVRLTFADAATLASADAALGNASPEQAFDVPAKQSRSYSWRIAVPDGAGFLTYKAVGATAAGSDGEEGFLPVLSRRILVTESLPLPIRGPATKEFDFKKMIESGQSDTLRHQSLTVQMVSQPAWYAVMALPYLMEFPHECSEQLFNRLYANSLARHIAGSDPKIRRIFDQWRNTPALDSPLLKNQDLKSVMIEETPWLRQATAESEARRNVGVLFDANRLDSESERILSQLAERQLSDGLWPWFPGGRPSEYISLYIVTGFARLRHLGAEVDVAPAIRALTALDAWMTKRHAEILKWDHPELYVPGSLEALYLYSRSFYLKDQPVAPAHRAAVDFFLGQSRKFWTKVGSRQSEAHLALALQRFGDRETPPAIIKSLKERSVNHEEMGMFWRDTELSWWWYHAPIETQALMIEAFDEIARDTQAVEDCKVWLLKQKQTQNWKTTKATADAVYGLLLRGTNLLASDALVEVALGGETIKPEKVEAGTGFYEQKFVRGEIKPEMGRVTVKKTDEGVSWGSVHWQYLEDMRKITPHEGTPLKLKKALFIKENTKRGPVLTPVTGPVAVGDELVVRLELRTDRDMEYVHLKDQRGSGTEPVNVLSGYRYQDGLGYYESTRDTASHFFIEYLPKGTYVFEYSTRIQLRGSYQTGIAEIQCMYAPEFNSHSESLPLEVK
ncbi:hypothetical protein ESB00_13595 [Oleiharenicola lentus]|uniref:Alpha-2-macroglobulin domain-containing protein n=1 Tax=Oleiharenicola lentus TaxID=2508720 RepID=A0A4Q1CCK0_9BACT|nr:alpha-2-macroglobulin family protein [Oleiharenicola lentus]RXK56854.1 hypothetical protein ESB00_13595 [Oleiharenicola lentus]